MEPEKIHSMLIEIKTDRAPQAVGPYSQGVKAGNLLFVSGQIPIDPETGEVVGEDIAAQTEQVLHNLEAVLEEAGATLEQVVRVDIFLKDLGTDFSVVNELYAQRFKGPVKPVRQTVEVSKLPLNVDIEMSCIAYLGDQ